MYIELFLSDMSCYIRAYWQRVGFTLTDSQLATVIWNAPKRNLDEKLAALREIMEKTNDSTLRIQISKRLDEEKIKLAAVKDNSFRKYVYAVIEDASSVCGYFDDYDTAVTFVQYYSNDYSDIGLTFSIEKQLLITTEEFETEINSNNWDKILQKTNMEYPGDALGVVVFDRFGEIMRVTSDELLTTTAMIDTTKSFRK